MKEHECKGCRRRRILVIHLRGLGYCEDCRHRVPKKQDVDAYFKMRDREVWEDHRPRQRFGNGTSIDKE